MSSDEGFLTRWSRRKEAARRSEDATVPVNVPAEAPDEIAAPTAEAGAQVSASPVDDAPVPLEELPPIESIGPETDLTPWLKRNVPPAWRQAALRRLWVSDPGIRDFVGLADYDWDWNTPDGMPGYGPLEIGEAVRKRLLAAVEGAPPPADERVQQNGASIEPPADERAPGPAPEPDEAPAAVRLPPEPSPAPSTIAPTGKDHTDLNRDLGKPSPSPRRRSGSATPV
ncbi:hypothetical protein BOQ54_07315 [Chelatococcus daeguensis]|uniref:DUF3306 domain-containing protein n=1 Tax=Chelatococcus daeguensis TaxID=444444 RepID=A0AAC9NYM7_9HYPH|nr:DUF3306 domain-containing protein [Chelatococcus daeguensis]APF37160.1 hypothetical protein BOQ54_07315 [Chelatococcus daeguensis]